jgi:3-hydroxyisobutyrate dehydrogenase-like beta-hydroxyacid dehydrogenase
VIGLGNMGSAMAANLVKAGFDVLGTDLVAEYRAALIAAGGRAAADVGEVGRACRHLILSLPSDDALQAVCAELAASCARGAIVLETSTLPVAGKQKARALLADHGVILLDAPLSGTGAQAKTADLVVFASGDADAIRECAPIMAGFSRAHYDLGEFGNGMKMKLVANHLVAIHNVAAAEAILLGVRSGLDAGTLVQIIGDGAGSSRMFQIRGPAMVDRTWDEATITNRVFQKDLRLIGDALTGAGCPAPLFSATLPVYAAAMASGHAEHDPAAVYEVLERMAQAPGEGADTVH